MSFERTDKGGSQTKDYLTTCDICRKTQFKSTPCNTYAAVIKQLKFHGWATGGMKSKIICPACIVNRKLLKALWEKGHIESIYSIKINGVEIMDDLKWQKVE